MSKNKWLSVHSRNDSFQEVDLGWHNSRNITAEDLQEMLDNDEPIPIDWYRKTDQGSEISESFDNILHAVRTIEYETDGKTDWCLLACSVIQDVAASYSLDYKLGSPPLRNRQNEANSGPNQKSPDSNNAEDEFAGATRE